MMRRVAYTLLFLLAGILMPVLIWVAFFVAIRRPLVLSLRQLALPWRRRLASTMACRIDSDCPPNYVCVGGKCMPAR